jgi:predicted TIM-barrel fold metal-dependent hydrolase
MRNGFKVWDTDTHIHPTVESLEPYYDSALRARMPQLDQFKAPARIDPTWSPQDLPGRHQYRFPGILLFKRVLGQAEPPAVPVRNYGKFMGTVFPAPGVADDQVDTRIKELDQEGVDLQLIVPGVPTGVFNLKDSVLEMGLIRAHNRFINDFCGKYPHRLKSLMVVSGNAVDESVAEIRRWGRSRWAAGIWPFPGMEKPLDHPDMEPIWAACADEGLCVVHHSLTWTPPYFPGYRDVWDNLFLGRSAAHPWGAMRAMAAFIGSGIMDRYPALRFGILECGCGWLPFWARRLEDQAHYVGTTAPLNHRISEYITDGRFFASLEMSEGEDLIKMVTDFLGEGILMYASDYPHPECFFPASVDQFLRWEGLSGEQKRKLLWDNPVRFYGEP